MSLHYELITVIWLLSTQAFKYFDQIPGFLLNSTNCAKQYTGNGFEFIGSEILSFNALKFAHKRQNEQQLFLLYHGIKIWEIFPC